MYKIRTLSLKTEFIKYSNFAIAFLEKIAGTTSTSWPLNPSTEAGADIGTF